MLLLNHDIVGDAIADDAQLRLRPLNPDFGAAGIVRFGRFDAELTLLDKQNGLTQSSETILAQCRKMQTHIDYQMARARAVALRSVPGTRAKVQGAAEEVANALRRLYKGSGQQIVVDIPTAFVVACDPQDLNEMLANVVDNACKHAKSVIRLSAREDSQNHICLQVDDDGAGLPPEAFEIVFNIGERWDARTHGSGLGLAIVRDLARLYGGDVKLAKSSLGGLSVQIMLPQLEADKE